LDEISDLPPTLQPKLLRFVQDREYERVGDSLTRKADVRLIAATNIDLEKAVERGEFREDLYYRLNVIQITLPPLRERPDDVPGLAERLLAFHGRRNHRCGLSLTPEALAALGRYTWPGNVRELSNVIERAAILCRSEQIGPECLPGRILPAEFSVAIGDPVTIAKVEEQHIRRVLAKAKSLQEAARTLGVDQATLWRRRKKYRI